MSQWTEMLPALSGIRVGRIRGVDDRGLPVVEVAGEGASLVTASVVWMPNAPDWSTCIGSRVLVVCPDAETEFVVLALLDAPQADSSPESLSGGSARVGSLQRRVHLSSEREFVIQCGKSKIALRSDGRIEIRGGYLLSRSTGPVKIKGGSVDIN